MPGGGCSRLVQNMPNTHGETLIFQPSGGPVSGPGPPQAFLSSPSAGPGEPKAGASRRAIFQGVGAGVISGERGAGGGEEGAAGWSQVVPAGGHRTELWTAPSF